MERRRLKNGNTVKKREKRKAQDERKKEEM